MEIRNLTTPEDHLQYRAICMICFPSASREDIRPMFQNPPPHTNEGNCAYWGAFDPKGQLHSALMVIPYEMRMNKLTVKMGGIAGVVTRPESRGLGLGRKIFQKAYQGMAAEKQAFSYLFPFSWAYYRKLGYDVCRNNNSVNIPIASFSGYPYPQNIEAYDFTGNVQPYMDIYNDFTKGRNLSIVRDRPTWEKLLSKDPYKDAWHSFLNHDQSGTPNAYITYTAQKNAETHGYNIAIQELCWRTTEGLHSIFGFIGKLSAEFASVNWNAPCDINVHTLFPEAHNTAWQVHASGMNRIMDTSVALESLCAPHGAGKVTMEIADPLIQNNSGIYNIEWENGQLSVAKSSSSHADASTSIQTLAQLVSGYLTPAQAIFKTDTRVYSNHEEIGLLFPRKNLYMYETF